MSSKKLMTGNKAAAWGARLSSVDYIPAYPITPQTEIIETLSTWTREGEMQAKFTQFESEHSMLAAAGAASLTGARVFTATSSQGMLYGLEMLYNISGWRAPMVLVNVARALAAPITLEPDHNDVLATRDSGFLQFHAETCQEVLDLIILAYRIAEDKSVVLPAIVNMDGFYLSFTREQVELPDKRLVNEFLPEYRPENPFRATSPVAKGAIVVGGHVYSYFRYHIHAASLRAAELLKRTGAEYEELFGRRYEAVEPYMLDDADYVLVMSNSFATIGKQAVQRMRAKGVHAGLLKLRMLRPFPAGEVVNYLTNRKVVAVLDQNLAPGSGGIIYPEIVASLYHDPNRPKYILPVIGGLGGKRLSHQEMDSIFELMCAVDRGNRKVAPLLLMSEDELESVRKELVVAGLEKEVSR